jgi:hypothetical protein
VAVDINKQYRRDLLSRGPVAPVPGDEYGWFEVQFEEQGSNAITAQYQGHTYMLLSNDPADTMLMGQGGPTWGLEDVGPAWDVRSKSAVVNILLDDAGAKLFRELTTSHLHKRVAILVNDKVLSAPIIQSVIGAQSQIPGRFTQQQAEAIARSLVPCVENVPATQSSTSRSATRPAPSSQVLGGSDLEWNHLAELLRNGDQAAAEEYVRSHTSRPAPTQTAPGP